MKRPNKYNAKPQVVGRNRLNSRPRSSGWDRIERLSIPEPNSGCLLWCGRADKNGYGIIRMGYLRKAHRVAWEIRRGPIPDDLFVCHKCDVPACVNPDHMFLGTSQDNTADRDRKGRGARPQGVLNAFAKLTDRQVIEIRREAGTLAEIGQRYGVSRSLVGYIRARKIWRHV